jgi:hypothetical protein
MEQPDGSKNCFRTPLLSCALLVLAFDASHCARPSETRTARVSQHGSLVAEPASDAGAEVHANASQSVKPKSNSPSLAQDPFGFDDALTMNGSMHNGSVLTQPGLAMQQKGLEHGIPIGSHPLSGRNIVLQESSHLNPNVPVALVRERPQASQTGMGIQEMDPAKMKKLQELHDGQGFRGQLANFFHRTIAQEPSEEVGGVLQDDLEGRVDVMQDHVHDMERQGHASHKAMQDYQDDIADLEDKMMSMDQKLDILENQRKVHYANQEIDRMAAFDDDRLGTASRRPPRRQKQTIPVELHVHGNMSLQPVSGSRSSGNSSMTGGLTGELSQLPRRSTADVDREIPEDIHSNPFGFQDVNGSNEVVRPDHAHQLPEQNDIQDDSFALLE